jgi:hypothetical protein
MLHQETSGNPAEDATFGLFLSIAFSSTIFKSKRQSGRSPFLNIFVAKAFISASEHPNNAYKANSYTTAQRAVLKSSSS